MNERPTSFSFPRGAQCDRAEAQARADLNMAQVISIGAARSRSLEEKHKPCPFCATMPPLAAEVHGRFVVECESEECAENGREVRCYASTLDGAWKLWDGRA